MHRRIVSMRKLQNFTWPILETLVPRLCAGHGIDFNFAGCIVVRSNWEAQAEKELMADRAARLALAVGAQGAIVTTNVRGQRFARFQSLDFVLP